MFDMEPSSDMEPKVVLTPSVYALQFAQCDHDGNQAPNFKPDHLSCYRRGIGTEQLGGIPMLSEC